MPAFESRNSCSHHEDNDNEDDSDNHNLLLLALPVDRNNDEAQQHDEDIATGERYNDDDSSSSALEGRRRRRQRNHNNDNSLLLFWNSICSNNTISWSEVSGSCGDLGTFIPLFVALSQQRSIPHANAALWWTGVANVITGLHFGLPMPVQPMKAIAAVALAQELTAVQVTMAGLWMGVFLMILGITNGALVWIDRVVPKAVVAGLQLGVGFHLVLHGGSWVKEQPSVFHSVDGQWLTLVCFVIAWWGLLIPRRSNNPSSTVALEEEKPKPVGIFLMILGAVLAVAKLASGNLLPAYKLESIIAFPLSSQSSNHNNATLLHDLSVGLLDGALPQLPLTTLNSVVSVCCLATSLFATGNSVSDTHHDDSQGLASGGQHQVRITQKRLPTQRQVCYSVGFLNVCLLPLGGMPICHGAGGLAGQYKMGGRHGTSVIILGLVKMVLSVVLGTWLVPFLDAIPKAVLSVLVFVAGVELGQTGLLLLLLEKQHDRPPASSEAEEERVGGGGSFADDDDDTRRSAELRRDLTTALVTCGVILAFKTHIGVAAGLLVHRINSSNSETLQSNTATRTAAPGSEDE